MAPPLKPNVVKSALETKGCELAKTHHTMFRKRIDGRVVVVTRISHQSKDIGDDLISLMARQCHLSRAQFRQLVDCTLDETEWDRLILESIAPSSTGIGSPAK